MQKIHIHSQQEERIIRSIKKKLKEEVEEVGHYI